MNCVSLKKIDERNNKKNKNVTVRIHIKNKRIKSFELDVNEFQIKVVI